MRWAFSADEAGIGSPAIGSTGPGVGNAPDGSAAGSTADPAPVCAVAATSEQRMPRKRASRRLFVTTNTLKAMADPAIMD